MQRSHFRLWGIPVRIDPSFALVALFGLGIGSPRLAVAWVAIVFVTTLVHELGHAFAFRRYGRGSSITLWAFGGLTQGEGPAMDRGKSIAVSLAGPFAGMILLGVPALLIRNAFPPTSIEAAHALNILIWVAITWSAVNLLPIIPLDGGHVATHVLEGVWGTAGVRAAYLLSIAVAAAAGGYAMSRGYTFAALYGAFFIMQNARDLAGLRDATIAQLLVRGHGRLDAGDTTGALRDAEDVLRQTRNDTTRAQAVDLAAWTHLAAGRRAEAARVLEDLPADLRPSRSLLTAFLIADGDRATAVETAVEALLQEEAPNAQLAMALERGGLTPAVAERLLQQGDDGRRAAGLLAAQLQQGRNRAGGIE